MSVESKLSGMLGWSLLYIDARLSLGQGFMHVCNSVSHCIQLLTPISNLKQGTHPVIVVMLSCTYALSRPLL